MPEATTKKVVRTPEFAKWIDGLADQVAKGAVIERIDRMTRGLHGSVRDLKNGLWEAKVDLGPGYRVYYAEAGTRIIVLLLGGTKGTQKSDIKSARKCLADLLARQQAMKKEREREARGTEPAAKKGSGVTIKPKRG